MGIFEWYPDFDHGDNNLEHYNDYKDYEMLSEDELNEIMPIIDEWVVEPLCKQ